MKLKNKQLYFVAVQLAILLFAGVMLGLTYRNGYTHDGFLLLSRTGLVCIILETALLAWQQKRIITIINVFFLLFSLFQFGIPICFALDKDFETHHLLNFNDEILVNAAAYTVLSISLFATALSVMLVRKKTNLNRNLFFRSDALNDEKIVTNIAKVIFALTSLVVIPLYLYVAFLSITKGFSQQTRGILSSSNIFNLARIFFFSSGMLYLCYNDKNYQDRVHKIIEGCILSSIVLTLLIGARGEGLTWLVAYIYGKKTIIKEERMKREWSFILVLLVLVLVSTLVAEIRSGSEISIIGVLKGNFIKSFISELGFNFTSICYVMLYVPGVLGFQLGYTYMASVLSLIPSTIDFMGFSGYFRNQLPLYTFAELLHDDFNGTLDFGIGFSFNAEAFYNFSWFGCLMVIPLAAFLVWTEREDYIEKNSWNKYVKIIILRNLFMFPRQMSFDFIDSFLYQIVFIAIIIILTRMIVNRKRKLS